MKEWSNEISTLWEKLFSERTFHNPGNQRKKKRKIINHKRIIRILILINLIPESINFPHWPQVLSVNFYFSFVSNSLAYITIPKNNRKIKR